MQVKTLITSKIRPYIGDSVSPYAYSDKEIIALIASGLARMFAAAPMLFCGTSIVTELPEAPTSVSGELPIVDRACDALAHYCAWQILSMNTEDASIIALAEKHHQNYELGLL